MFLQFAVPGSVAPFLSKRLTELGFTPMQLGWASATQAVAALVAPLVAGQVAHDEDGNLVGGNDAAAQARQVLTNLQRVVESAGGRMEDVARTTLYLTRLEDRGPVGEVRKEFFPAPAPANTLLVVSSLASPDYLVEIDAIVALP